MRPRTSVGLRTQTDALAKCCTGTYYRHSAHTWFTNRPWSVQMPEHHITCTSCGEPLTYEEKS